MESTSDLNITRELNGPIITERRIDARASRISHKIARDYLDKKPIFICIEKGGRKWADKVVLQLRSCFLDFEVGSIIAKSYICDKSSGTVHIDSYVGPNLQNRHVVFLEDILDTLKTITAIDKWAKGKGTASVSVCAMLFKRKSDNITWQIRSFFGHRLARYIGFYIADLFVIGAGLDYNEACRELSPDGVYVMTPEAKALLDKRKR